MQIEFNATLEQDGKLIVDDNNKQAMKLFCVNKAKEICKDGPRQMRITIEETEDIRDDDQNHLMHYWLGILAKDQNCSTDYMKREMLKRCYEKTGDTKYGRWDGCSWKQEKEFVGASTAKMSKKRMMFLLNECKLVRDFLNEDRSPEHWVRLPSKKNREGLPL